jgi:IS30 family transposase
MTGNGGAGDGASTRPRCGCHDEPMDKAGSWWACAVKRRARQLARYSADPASANYARTRRALRSRIERKRQMVEELEQHLEEEIAS